MKSTMRRLPNWTAPSTSSLFHSLICSFPPSPPPPREQLRNVTQVCVGYLQATNKLDDDDRKYSVKLIDPMCLLPVLSVFPL